MDRMLEIDQAGDKRIVAIGECGIDLEEGEECADHET